MITYNNIVNRFETFVEQHLFLRTFTHGSPSAVDLDKFELYPLLHLVYTGSSYDVQQKTYSFEIYILDLPPDKEKKVANQKALVSNAEQVAEDILADMRTGGNVFDFGYYYSVSSASTTTLEEETSNVLSGVLLDISIQVGYEYDSCNAPLEGVSPSGSGFPVTGANGLRIIEEDGTPDVTNVTEIIVSNDTLTDNGGGIVTLNTGGGTTAGAVGTYEYNTSGTQEKYTNNTGGFLSGIITVASYDVLSFVNRNLFGSYSFVHNYQQIRRELYGLTSGASIRVQYTLAVTYESAGVIVIQSTASNPSFTTSIVPTGAGAETINLDGTFTNSIQNFIYLNLQVSSSVNCSVQITNFKLTITNPI